MIQSIYYLFCHFKLNIYYLNFAKLFLMKSTTLQITLTYQPVFKDQNIESLFQLLEKQHLELQISKKHHQEIMQKIQLDIQSIEKGYQSQGCNDELPSTRIHKRKNSLIRKIKIKQKKQKNIKTQLYIKTLQGRLHDLQKQLDTMKKLNEMNQLYIKKLSEGQHITNGLFLNKQRHIQNIQTLLKKQNPDLVLLKKQIQNMRFRQGVLGKDRVNAINYYFCQISQLFFPDILKYMIKTATDEKDFFDPTFVQKGYIQNHEQEWRKKLINSLNVPIQKVNKLKQLREQILNQKIRLDLNFKSFYESKCAIMNSVRTIQKTLDRMHLTLSPIQVAKTIIFIDQYRFQKGLSIKQLQKNVFDQMALERYQYNVQDIFELQQSK